MASRGKCEAHACCTFAFVLAQTFRKPSAARATWAWGLSLSPMGGRRSDFSLHERERSKPEAGSGVSTKFILYVCTMYNTSIMKKSRMESRSAGDFSRGDLHFSAAQYCSAALVHQYLHAVRSSGSVQCYRIRGCSSCLRSPSRAGSLGHNESARVCLASGSPAGKKGVSSCLICSCFRINIKKTHNASKLCN